MTPIDEEYEAWRKKEIAKAWTSRPGKAGAYWMSPFCDGGYDEPRLIRVVEINTGTVVVEDWNVITPLGTYLKDMYPNAKWMLIPVPEPYQIKKVT